MKVRIATKKDINGLMTLYSELSSRYRNNPDVIERILEDLTDTYIFVGEHDGQIVGTVTLSIRGVPIDGLVGYIDDLVVQSDFRGLGFGKALIDNCVTRAVRSGCVRIELTSQPHRQKANILYDRLGFSIRDTNVYVKRF